MTISPEKANEGRRNFLRILAGTPALAALGVSAALKGPVRGGPVRVGFVGVGGQGRVLLSNVDPAFANVVALCDINPASLTRADEVLARNKVSPAPHFADWREMLQKADIEAVIMAPPLWAHADLAIGCLEAGKHVLCEKMMASDITACERMRETARRSGKVLEIGYQRTYNAMYHAAYEGIVKSGALGDIYHVRLAWHRNGNWRRQGQPPSADFDASKWGYPTFEHLLNWRLYSKYSQGLMAELCSHQLNAANWFLGSKPEAVYATGGVYRFKDGREVFDHIYATFEYPNGQTATFTSLESNAFDDYYEMFMGTKGTLILRREIEALFFEEGGGETAPTSITVAPQTAGPVALSSETQPVNTNRQMAQGSAVTPLFDRPRSTRLEIQRFCSAIRVGTPLACGPDKAFDSAAGCIRANESAMQKARLAV